MKRPQLPITPNEPLGMQPNLFGPPEPVWPVHWRVQGDKLRDARLERGLSLAEGARVLGLEPKVLLEVERGGHSFALSDALAMLRSGR